MAADPIETRKQAADALLKAGEHSKAAEAYRQLLCDLTRSTQSSQDNKALLVRVCCNASLACSRCGRATEALLYADKALSADSSNLKALYRKAQALRLLGNLSEASSVLARVEAAHKEAGTRSLDTEREREALNKEIERRGTACSLAGAQSSVPR